MTSPGITNEASERGPLLSHRHFTRFAAIVGLLFSSILLVDHISPNRGFCGYQSDCDQVLFSDFGRLAGVPLPVVGVFGFVALFSAAFFPDGRIGKYVLPLAICAGLAGLILILLQLFVLRRVCPFCLITDISAVAVAAIEIGFARWGVRVPTSPGSAPALERGRWIWLAAAAVAAGAPHIQPGREVPPQIKNLWVTDKVNIVEIADFHCRHCRKMHAVLKQFLREQGDRVHFSQITVPIARHSQSRIGTQAYLCAREQGKGLEMSERLFAADDFTRDRCLVLAEAIGLSMPAFRSCLGDPTIEERLDADIAWVKAISPQGLPVVWIQDQMFPGVQTQEALQVALARAERRLKRLTR
jgi:uncharacterized membrane protein/predicted DsbA family dithiol-disulfide isomerase